MTCYTSIVVACRLSISCRVRCEARVRAGRLARPGISILAVFVLVTTPCAPTLSASRVHVLVQAEAPTFAVRKAFRAVVVHLPAGS